MTVYGYARVSTDGQSVDAQVRQLTDAGCEKVLREVASGAKSDRAQLARAIAALHPGDVLMVTRLARSTRDLLNTLATITDREASSSAVWRRSRSRIAFCLAASGDTPRRRLTRCKSTTLRPC